MLLIEFWKSPLWCYGFYDVYEAYVPSEEQGLCLPKYGHCKISIKRIALVSNAVVQGIKQGEEKLTTKTWCYKWLRLIGCSTSSICGSANIR